MLMGKNKYNSIDELKKIPTSKWARIWCDLNSWEFPKELEHIKPDYWDSAEMKTLGMFLRPLMQLIEDTIGEKVCNRYWNKDMTDKEHEIFWARADDNTWAIWK